MSFIIDAVQNGGASQRIIVSSENDAKVVLKNLGVQLLPAFNLVQIAIGGGSHTYETRDGKSIVVTLQ